MKQTDMTSRPAILIVAMLCMGTVAGCATRPSGEVLMPHAVQKASGEKITILTATNRSPDEKKTGFGGVWAGRLTLERYVVSVPPQRKDTSIAYPGASPDPKRQYLVTSRQQLSQDAFVQAATHNIGPDGIAGIFVHGYNYSYQEALFRTAQIGADAKAPGAPILFSWPSAATVAGYVADRDAALASRSELDALIKLLSDTGKFRRIVLLGHSMGGFLVMEAVRQLKLQGRDDVLDKLTVVLAAPDIDLDVFIAQLRDIGKMKTPITVLVSKDDRALSASSFISGERARVGRVDIDDPEVRRAAEQEGVRVIDISSIEGSDGLGHDRYASLARFGADFAAAETRKTASINNVGAYVFDATGAIVSSPFRLAGRAVASQ